MLVFSENLEYALNEWSRTEKSVSNWKNWQKGETEKKLEKVKVTVIISKVVMKRRVQNPDKYLEWSV